MHTPVSDVDAVESMLFDAELKIRSKQFLFFSVS